MAEEEKPTPTTREEAFEAPAWWLVLSLSMVACGVCRGFVCYRRARKESEEVEFGDGEE